MASNNRKELKLKRTRVRKYETKGPKKKNLIGDEIIGYCEEDMKCPRTIILKCLAEWNTAPKMNLLPLSYFFKANRLEHIQEQEGGRGRHP